MIPTGWSVELKMCLNMYMLHEYIFIYLWAIVTRATAHEHFGEHVHHQYSKN